MQNLFDVDAFNNELHTVRHPISVVLVGEWSTQEKKTIHSYFPGIAESAQVVSGVCNICHAGTMNVPAGRFHESHGTYIFSVPSYSGDFSMMAYEAFSWAVQACYNIFVKGIEAADMSLSEEELIADVSGRNMDTYAFDIETTGLNPLKHEIISASYCRLSDHRCCCVYGTSATKALIKRVGSNARLVVCNAPFEIKWCTVHTGVKINVISDVQVLAALLNEEGHKGLEYLSMRVGMAGYDYKMQEHTEPIGANGKVVRRRNHYTAPKDVLLGYNALDAVVTAKAYALFATEIKRESEESGANLRLVHSVMMDTQRALATMEVNGMFIDGASLVQARADLVKELRDTVNRIRTEAVAHCERRGDTSMSAQIRRANLNNPADKMTILRICGVRSASTSKKVIAKYATKHAIVRDMLVHSSASSLMSGIMQYALDSVADDCFLRSSFSATALVTGQLTSRDPPMLNIAKSPIRRMFSSRFGSSGVILSLDYSQLHLRIMANISKCYGFVNAFTTGRDPHSMTGAEVVMGIDEDVFLERLRNKDPEVEEARQIGKRVNFSVITEVSAHGLSELLSISVTRAGAILARFYDVFPEIKAKQDEQHAFAASHGYVVSPTGRIRHLPLARSGDMATRERAMRQATDYLISNPGRFTTLIAMNAMHRKLTENGMQSCIINQLHDAIIHDVHVDELQTVLGWASECYIKAPSDAMPDIFRPVLLEMDGHYGPNWYYKGDDATSIQVR